MTLDAAVPRLVSHDNEGIIITLIVPAPNGCNLHCPFCFIRQRNEHLQDILLDRSDYSRFIYEVAEAYDVSAVCVQGYEPLLEDAFPYTGAALRAATRIGKQTSLVTNGTKLSGRIVDLTLLQLDYLSVSLDAADPEPHDRQRGKKGAWKSTIDGITAAKNSDFLRTEIAVGSVLMPKKRSQLEGMPSLLARLGIKRWVVSALRRVGGETAGGTVSDFDTIYRDLDILLSYANEFGIEMLVDDELSNLKRQNQLNIDNKIKTNNRLKVRQFTHPDNVIRLLPSGRCSIGYDLLKKVSNETSKWNPQKIHAGKFVESIQKIHNTDPAKF